MKRTHIGQSFQKFNKTNVHVNIFHGSYDITIIVCKKKKKRKGKTKSLMTLSN